MTETQQEPIIGEDEVVVEEHEQPSFVFEQLTLWQMLGLLLYRPVRVLQQLWRVMLNLDQDEVDENQTEVTQRPTLDVPTDEKGTAPEGRSLELPNLWQYLKLDREQTGIVGLLLFAIAFTLFGAATLHDNAVDAITKENGDLGGAPFWIFLGGFMYLAMAFVQARVWWHQVLAGKSSPEDETPDDDTEIETSDSSITTQSNDILTKVMAWLEHHAVNIGLVPVGIVFTLLAYRHNVTTDVEGNINAVVFTRSGFVTWALSILVWCCVFAVDFAALYERFRGKARPNIVWQWPRLRWAYLGLALVMVLAAYFRLYDLDGVPPDMTSDHIEKLIDAGRVQDGYYGIFFANNGGREAFQMYVVAAIADWGGVGLTFRALKYATVIEGLLTVFLAFFVAKTVIGRETPERDRLGDWVGVVMAALIAVSAWHTMLSRLGLRIVLTPLTVLLVIYFLTRVIRYRRQVDFVLLGLVLGFGTYFYQANRMLPILVVLSVGLAAVFNSRMRWQIALRYVGGLMMVGIVAIVVYVPMYRYSQEFPREYWNRTYGRIFGDGTFDCIDPQTRQLGFCPPSLGEALNLLGEERYGPAGDQAGYEAIRANYEDALVSYMWEGDGQWISNGKGRPAMDTYSAGFYMLGLVMWFVLLIRRRDVALMVIPLGVLVMLLPSALAIAPGLNENPSYTRISGTLPFVYLIAALPLGALADQITRSSAYQRVIYSFAALVVAFAIYLAAGANHEAFFEDYRDGYEMSWRPYSQIAAPMKDFAEGRGSYGNVFYVNWPHWLDHRILGSVAGDLTWPNGLLKIEDVYVQILMNEGTDYAYDSEQPLLFYLHREDEATLMYLEQNFPGGESRLVRADRGNDFYVYEAPPGYDWLAARLSAETARLGCITNCLPGPR